MRTEFDHEKLLVYQRSIAFVGWALVAKRRISKDGIGEGKALLLEIVALLVGLIKNNSDGRFFEETPAYGGKEQDLD